MHTTRQLSHDVRAAGFKVLPQMPHQLQQPYAWPAPKTLHSRHIQSTVMHHHLGQVPTPSAGKNEIAAHIENTIRALANQTRIVDPPYKHHNQASLDDLYMPGYRMVLARFSEPIDLQTYRRYQAELFRQYPQIRGQVLGVECNVLEESDGRRSKVEAFLNIEVTGFPEGVTRHFTTLMKWRWSTGQKRWLLAWQVRYEGAGAC